jgi:hypothetical protein
MPTPTSDTLFQGDHRGTPNPADPNLFSLGDMAAAMGTDSLAVSVATSKVTSTAASGALDSVPGVDRVESCVERGESGQCRRLKGREHIGPDERR